MNHADPAVGSSGLLRSFHETGLLSWGDVHTAQQCAFLYDETDERVILALALTVRALRAGSVCLALEGAADWTFDYDEQVLEIPTSLWPESKAWLAAVETSPMVALGPQAASGRVLRLVEGLLYLERYWQEELAVSQQLRRRRDVAVQVDVERVRDGLTALFGTDLSDDSQCLAAAMSVLSPVTVIAGGPGTGKTTTIARVLALLRHTSTHQPRVALAAPTGKAAARVEESLNHSLSMLPAEYRSTVAGTRATTLHRLLGWTPDARNRFVHDQGNPLPHDVVIVDEASMVSLTMMSRLLSALRPEASLILVGDPDQLAPVEAGAVLADVVSSPQPENATLATALATFGLPSSGPVVRLTKNWRFDGAIGEFAEAVRGGFADRAVELAGSGGEGISLKPAPSGDLRRQVVIAGTLLVRAAREGRVMDALAALDEHRLLCAHRHGPFGVAWWSRQVEAWLAEAVPGFASEGEWYPGRPLLVTLNSPDLGLYNGDTGVVVITDGQARAHFGRGAHVRSLSPFLMEAAQTVHAMTVHKAQGSQFARVSLILPPPDSPLLTRELLYTAVTRATDEVSLIGSEESLRVAVRRPARRASGLSHRL